MYHSNSNLNLETAVFKNHACTITHTGSDGEVLKHFILCFMPIDLTSISCGHCSAVWCDNKLKP